MSRIKEHYHELITTQMRDEVVDDDFQFQEWRKNEPVPALTEDQILEYEAEKAEFMKFFEQTGHYPI